MVEHCGGPKHDGNFVPSLVLTDIATGWTECLALPVRNQALVVQGIAKVATDLPFPMRGIDTDNDSAFMSQMVLDYCKAHHLEQTRSRAYKKNDQAWVEQKNGAIVRRLVGYARLSGMAATQALAQLYTASRSSSCPGRPAPHSPVTLLAKFRGLSTSVPRAYAV